jgi:hypothetical protein
MTTSTIEVEAVHIPHFDSPPTADDSSRLLKNATNAAEYEQPG